MEKSLGIKYYNLGQKGWLIWLRPQPVKLVFGSWMYSFFECVPYRICRGMYTALETVHCGEIASIPIVNTSNSTVGVTLYLFIAGRKVGPREGYLLLWWTDVNHLYEDSLPPSEVPNFPFLLKLPYILNALSLCEKVPLWSFYLKVSKREGSVHARRPLAIITQNHGGASDCPCASL